MHTDFLSHNFKDHKGGREQGSMNLNPPLFSPIFLLMFAFCFPRSVSLFALPPSSSSQASQGMDRAGLCHRNLSAASPDLKGGTM